MNPSGPSPSPRPEFPPSSLREDSAPAPTRSPLVSPRAPGFADFCANDFAIADFGEDLVAQGYSERTVRTYRYALHRLEYGYGLHTVRNAAELLRRMTDLEPRTRALYLSVARVFDRWCVETGRTTLLALPDRVHVRVAQGVPRPLSVEDDARLERAVQRCRDHRLRLLYSMMRQAGMRIGEALAVRAYDVEMAGRREAITIPKAKGRKGRSIPVLDRVLRDRLRTAVLPSSAGAGNYYLVAHRDEPFRPWSYSAAAASFARTARKARVVCHPHQLRHTFATEMLRKGMDADYLRRILGHATHAMLDTYADLEPADLRREMERIR